MGIGAFSNFVRRVVSSILLLNRYDLSGFRYGTGTAVTSFSVSPITPAGVAPYTYVWTRVGATAMFASNPNDATTSFLIYFSSTGVDATDTFICTATDATAATFISAPVSVFLEAI